jgi:hypothetical protein
MNVQSATNWVHNLDNFAIFSPSHGLPPVSSFHETFDIIKSDELVKSPNCHPEPVEG